MDPYKAERQVYPRLKKALRRRHSHAYENLDWLHSRLHPYFFLTMADEVDALVNLAAALHTLSAERRLILADGERKLILACLNLPGSLYHSLLRLRDREISYAELTHSFTPVPGAEHELEVQRFEFNRRPPTAIAEAGPVEVPPRYRRGVARALRRLYPDFAFEELDQTLQLLWVNNDHYVRISPSERVARLLWLYQQGRRNDGLYLDVENTEDVLRHRESRLLFSVGNPPEGDFLAQTLEVFHRLEIGVRRAYCLTIDTGIHPYFLGTFYVATRTEGPLERNSDLLRFLRAELYNTQILATKGYAYTDFVRNRLMTGEEATLTNAMIAFCHTSLAHNQPDRFDLEEVRRALHSSPEIVLRLCRLFRARFDPDLRSREEEYLHALHDVEEAVTGYNTGHRHLDEVRRTIYRTALLFIQHTLKTNFYVPEKHGVAFRLDPRYLRELGPDFTGDLPPEQPFRITFFFGRHGAGYHVGFSDIARGGWRTVICATADDVVTNANTLFREVAVLAHTQHLKNKDIYEGGSKMVVVLDASDLTDTDLVTQRLYKLQYGFTNAFLDIFVTRGGRAAQPRVVDYYGQEEPIELGPDENMHDAMIEVIARQSVNRGYSLGKGLISSKHVGINHKEHGVTSLGVVAFAESTLAQLGIVMRRDPFSVKITGGPSGDVAGNAMKLLLDRCPRVSIRLIVAGSGALYDPAGIDAAELRKLLLQGTVDEFAAEKIHPGGFLLSRKRRRQEGLRELYRRLLATESGVVEQWVTTDEFHREFDSLIFSVPADLFLPAGGRPETIDGQNWERLFGENGEPTCRAIVEGANSFLTPEARTELQRRGVIVIRDASANKCGVIASSYEIIANLLMSDGEFLACKERYVSDVLKILEQRAQEEARLIFQRHRQASGRLLYTEISNALSGEINGYYSRLFDLFLSRPELPRKPLFQKALLGHLPALVRTDPRLRRRIGRIPFKHQCAMIASEIATRIVYRGGWEEDVESALHRYLKVQFGS